MVNKKNNTEACLDVTQEITSFTLEAESDTRVYERRTARWTAIITTRDKQEIRCRTHDVSERGASIKSPIKLSKGTVVVLQVQSFYNGEKRVSKIVAEIKHCAISKNEFTLEIFFKEASTGTFEFFQKYAERKI